MTPLLALAFVVALVPPVAPDGGTNADTVVMERTTDGDRSGVGTGAAATHSEQYPGGVRRDDSGDNGGDLVGLTYYVHCLACPAVDVTGLDPQYLTESVPIAMCESTMREGAVNPSGATGLMQVMLPLHLPKATALGYTAADMLYAEPNLRVAAVIWERQGWRPWSCWRR